MKIGKWTYPDYDSDELIAEIGLCRNRSERHACNKEPWDCSRVYEK